MVELNRNTWSISSEYTWQNGLWIRLLEGIDGTQANFSEERTSSHSTTPGEYVAWDAEEGKRPEAMQGGDSVKTDVKGVVERLMRSREPAVRLKILIDTLGESPVSGQARSLQQEVRDSPRVRRLLSQRDADGQIPGSVYQKWCGAHWVLADLADIKHPVGDSSLYPLRDQVYEHWLASSRIRERVISPQDALSYHRPGVPIVHGLARRCASQEGNALWSTLALGIADHRAEELADNLMKWQWPDGGWNCDRRPEARNSSFMETLIPLRALALYARLTGSARADAVAERAADVFLKRRMFKRLRDGLPIHEDFMKLHYPCYWHYDILFGLKVMAEAGFIQDERCNDALDILEGKQLFDGGFPAEGRYYKVVSEPKNSGSLVDWGEVDKKSQNEFITADALFVLTAAGRVGL